MRAVLAEKLKLDGVEFDELVLKDNLRNLLRGRFRALRGQVGYKLPVLLESRARAPVEAEEVLFGDDAEADAFIYSLYADMVARRVDEPVRAPGARGAPRSTPTTSSRIMQRSWRDDRPSATRCGASSSTSTGSTPPAYFARYGPRVVPIFNYFQAALVLMADGHLDRARRWLKVAVEMVQTAGYNLLTLSNSLPGPPAARPARSAQVAAALAEALQGPGGAAPRGAAGARHRRRVHQAAGGAGHHPAPAEAKVIDYLGAARRRAPPDEQAAQVAGRLRRCPPRPPCTEA